MEYSLLKFFHIIGAVLIGSGLIGVWMADLRSRHLHELKPFSEAVRNIAVSYDGLVVPGALLLLTSGTWTIVKFYGGWNFLQFPWLAGMVGLFVFEFIEGNTIARLYFVRLPRLTEYDEWPRGRIVHEVLSNRFVLYADRRIQQPETIVALTKAFHLQGHSVAVMSAPITADGGRAVRRRYCSLSLLTHVD